MRQKLGYRKAVKDMAFPDPLTFARADQPPLDTCGGEELGVGTDGVLLPRKVLTYVGRMWLR